MEDFDQDILPRCLGDHSGYYFPLSQNIPLLLVSRGLRQEALPVAFRHTTFRLDDMDDLAKLLIAAGKIGRDNLESLYFTGESRSDLQCRWEKYPDAEANHLKLPTLHASRTMQLLHRCPRLRRIRILFDECLLRMTPLREFKTDEGIQSLCSKQGLRQVEILGLDGDIIKDCALVDWLKAAIMDGNKNTTFWRWGIRRHRSHSLTLPTYAHTPLLLAQRGSRTHNVEGWTAQDRVVIGGNHDAARALLRHENSKTAQCAPDRCFMMTCMCGDERVVGVIRGR